MTEGLMTEQEHRDALEHVIQTIVTNIQGWNDSMRERFVTLFNERMCMHCGSVLLSNEGRIPCTCTAHISY